jgi:hypothetical protein
MKHLSKLLTVAGFLTVFQTVGFSQAPNLGAAESFSLFTASGAFDSSGLTYILGNIGTNAGGFTGFPPGVVNGNIHLSDASSLQAAADVNSAYNDMILRECAVGLGAIIGNNQILTPDVYCSGEATLMNGTLTFDAEGNPNALFFIKINGAFETADYSNVVLVNNASLCNIYWQINGAFILGSESVFRGTAIVNGAITLRERATLLGRGLSVIGAVLLVENTVGLGVQPNVTIADDNLGIVCLGDSVNLISSVSNGLNPVSYSWSHEEKTTSTIKVAPTTTTTYYCTVTTLNGCSPEVVSHEILVKALPVVTATASDTEISAGQTVVLTGGGALTYFWSDDVVDGVGFIPESSNTYMVTGTDGNECSNTDEERINIIPLSISLIDFKALAVGFNVQLDWETASETNNAFFIVQHSSDLVQYTEVLRIPGAGNSISLNHYCETNYAPYNGMSYYRLKQIDFDGNFTFSKIAMVNVEKFVDFVIYPNPFNQNTTISIHEFYVNKNVELQIRNAAGVLVLRKILKNRTTLLQTTELPAGLYIYQVLHNEHFIQTGKLVSQHCSE